MSNLIIQDLSEVEQLIDAPSALGAAPLAPSRRQGGVDSFVQENLQLAQRVGGRIGVEPHVLLGQWGLETGWGKSVIPGTNNLGNIKDFSGKGPSARDNMTGSVDAYKKFDTPDDFADGFSGLIERKYQTAMGAGGNSMRYFHALKKVGYAEDPNYIAKGSAAAAMAQRAMKTAGLSAASAPVQTASSRAPRYADRADSSADASQGGFISDLGTAVKQGVGMLSRNIRSSGSAALGNLSEVELLAEAQAAAAENDPQAKQALMAEIQLRKEANPESKVLTAITDVLGAAAANPEGTLQLVAEQAPNTLVTLGGGWAGAKAGAVAGGALGSVVPVVGTAAGAAAGGVLGFLGGMFLGNALIETGAKAMEKAGDAEGFTEQDRQDTLREGPKKAGVITAVDYLTFKLGGAAAKFINRGAIRAGARAEVKVLADAGVDISNGQSIARALAADASLRQAATKAGQDAASAAASLTQRAATAGGVVGMETLGEGGGEYLGELAADGEADPYDAAIEALASFTQSAPQAAASMTSSQGNDMSVRGMLKAKADAGGVLSRAALAGLPEDAADEVPAGAPVDPISARAIEIETQVRNEGLLEQLRNIGQPGRTTTELLGALAVAKNPKVDPAVRQQAVESLEMAMGWIRDGAMPVDAAIVQEESVDEAPIPAEAADNIAAADIGGVIEPVVEPKARRLVDLPKVATPAGNAPAAQRREASQIQAAVEAGFDTVERRADGVYLVHSGKNQESKLSGLGAMARARKLIADATDAAKQPASQYDPSSTTGESNGRDDAGAAGAGVGEQLHGDDGGRQGLGEADEGGEGGSRQHQNTGATGRAGRAAAQQGDRVADSARRDRSEEDVAIRDLAAAAAKQGRRVKIDAADPGDPRVQAAHNLFDAFERLTGHRAIPVVATGLHAFDGVQHGKYTFVNIDRPVQSLAWTIGHEFKHLSERLPGLAKLYNRIWDLIPVSAKAKYLVYLHETNQASTDQLSQATPDDLALLKEEMVADFMGQRFNDKAWLQQLAQQKPALFGDFVRDWVKALNALIGHLQAMLGRNGGSGNATKDIDALMAGYIAQLEEAKQIAFEVAVAWAERHPKLAKEAGVAARTDGVQLSARAETVKAYEDRIDAIFAGDQANRIGARILDRSDMLDMLGLGDQPILIAEGKVIAGMVNHPRMTADVWKKIPGWLDNPAAVFDSDTVDGRLVFIAPELLNGLPVRLIVEASPELDGLSVSLMVNAYDAPGRAPWMRWAENGLTRYIDKKKLPAILAPSGLQLTRVEQEARGAGRILTEKNLSGYRRSAGDAKFSARDEFPGLDPDFLDGELEALLQAELEAELDGNGSATQMPTAAELKDAGLLAEDAFPELFWQDEGATGYQLTTRIPDLYREGKTARIDMEQVGDDGLWRADMPTTWFGPGADEADGYAPMQDVQDFVRRQVAAVTLHKNGFDLLSAAPKAAVRKAVDGWKTASELDNVRAYKRPSAKATTLKDIAREMGLDEKYDVSIVIDTPYPGQTVYNIGFNSKTSEKRYGALLTLISDDGPKRLEVNTIELGRSGMGGAVYQLVSEFAARRNIPLHAESSVSAVNSYRRTEQMLSAALRTGKSNAMVPHKTQRVYGFNDKATTIEQHDDNLSRLVLATLRNAFELAPEVMDLQYHPQTGLFTLADGSDAERLASEILSRVETRALGLGRSQLARAAMTREMMAGKLKAEQIESFAAPVLYSAREALAAEYQAVVDQHMGKPSWMKAPNGQATKLTERQWVQVRTESFKKWFGDWEAFATKEGGVWTDGNGAVSKAVHKDTGEPLVVYHGTDKGGFMAFKNAGGQQRGDLGIFTTDNRDMARSYVRRGRVQDVMAPTSRDELEEAGFQFEEGFSIQEKFYPDMESAEEDRDDGDEIVPSVRVTDVDGYDLDGPRETHYRFTSLDQAVAAAAESFGGSENISTVYATFINLRNPNESDFEGALWNGSRDHQWVVEVGGEIQSDSDGTMYFNSQEEARDFAQTFLSEDDEDADPYDYVLGANEHYSTSDDEVRGGRRSGNDGTIIRNVIDDGGDSGPYAHEPSDVFVAFKPGQVKSAEWNTGEFGDVDDLRYSKRTQDAAAGDKTDVAQLPAGKPVPASVATGSLEQALAVARSGSYRRGRELKADLQQRVLAAADQAGVDLSERTQAIHQFLADMVRADAEFALKSNQNAVGWYDTKVSRALGALATVHPEIESDPKARLAFLWALATTSNGLKVAKNFELAERAYQAWKTTGTMPGDIGVGNAAANINKSLLMFNHLVEKVGGERLAKFMSTEFGAGEIERMLGVAVGGEWKSTPVRGAAILGPKIGNGFFSNLNGYFNSLTMDRWLMRTWGRLTGTLLQVDPKMVKASRTKLASSITAMDDAQRRTMSRLIGVPVKRRMTVAEIDAAATAIQKASMKVNVREQMMAAPAMDRVRRDGNGHHKYLDGQKEAPANPGERNWIRAVFQTALDSLRESGVGMTMSDLQALLWYPERRLYDAAKSDEDVADGYEDDEAPDYANAAMALALDNGVDLKTVVAAMDQAEKRGTVRGETLSTEERAAMLKEFRSAPKQGAQLAFEVAPDPADNAAVDAWGQFTTQERTKVTDTVRKAVVDDIATLVGVPVQKVAPATGGYAGLVNPSLIAEYQKTKVSLAHARSLASAIGYVLDQDSVALVDPRVESKNGLIRITFSGKVEPHANAIYQAIHAAVPEVDAFTARGNNFDILNFTDLSNEELNDLVVNALEASDIPLEAVTSFGDVHSELVEKASYESHLQGSRPGSGSEVRTGVEWLRDRARTLVKEGIREALDARRARLAAAARLADGSGRAAAKGKGRSAGLTKQGDGVQFSARQEASPEFQAWSAGLEVVEDGFYIGGPAVFRAYHGTTHNGITEFSRTGNKGGFLGQGPYFTTSPDDASINYAGIGPDLKSSIDRAVEDIGQSVGDDKAYAEEVLRDYFDATGIEQEITEENIDGLLEQYGDTAIEHAATSQLKGDSDGLVMPAYVKLANPADTVNGSLDYNLVENDDGDVIDETGSLVDWVLAARSVGERYDIGRDMEAYIDAMLADGDGARMADALSLASEHLAAVDDDNGEMISSGQVFSEIAEEAGYDGIVMDAGFHFGPGRRGFGGARIPGMPGVGDGTMHVVPFSAEQVKSAIGNSGAFNPESKDIRQSARTPGELFFSELSAQVEKSTMKQAPAAAWKTYIKALSSNGVKADEIEWTGVNDWLDLQTGKVPKEALLGYLDANGVQVTETVLGGDGFYRDANGNRVFDNETGDYIQSKKPGTKYENYTLPGGENYREVLLTLPVKVGRVDDETARRLGAEKGWDTDAPLYRSSHWNQGNVLAHIRVNDRTDADGKRVLFVEELQSDWQADGRKKGFDPVEKIEGLAATGIPLAPFVTSTDKWLNLALKRVIGMAVDGGYDAVAFVNGEQSAERYDLSKQIDRIDYNQNPDGTYNLSAIKNREELIAKDELTIDEIEGLVGKDVAKKIADGEGQDAGTVDRWDPEDTTPIQMRSLSGLDLKVGGEGMRAFYDKIVPNAVKALLKKVGGGAMESVSIGESGAFDKFHGLQDGRIEHTFDTRSAAERWAKLDTDREVVPVNSKQQPGFDITDAMREKLSGGMPLFSARDQKTDTAEFKRWWGDGNTMANPDGSPMVLFHGTTKANERTIGVFRRSKYGAMGPAIYLGDDAEASAGYNQGAMMKVYARGKYLTNMQWTGYINKHGWSGAEKAARDDGWSGVYDSMYENAIAVWDSQDIKSATKNNAQFDPTNPDIRYSIRNGNSLWDEPTASRFDDFVYKAQDKLIDLKRVVQSIKKSTGAIADDINAYLQEELFHGRAAKRTHDFGVQELTPLMEQLAADGLTIGDIEEYLHARHAKEANRVIADRNPGVPGLQDGGSGMKDADADAYFANLPAALRNKLQAAAAKVDAINDRTRQLYVDYGLESQDTVDSWKILFKHYIPLQREDKDGRGGMGIGQGFSVKGKETKGRTGSTRKVVDILANIAMQRERLIVRGEKNRVAAALVGLAAANPNPDFWSVGAPPAERVYDPKTNTVVDRVDPMYKSRDNVVVAKLSYPNGEVREMAVVFNEDDPRALRMAHAMKNMDAGKLEGILGVSAKITRYFSSINTQYNPVFGVVNLVRDVQGAMLNLGDTPLAGKRVRIARDTLSALRAIYGDLRAERRGGQATSPWAALWEEFADQGGKTGYRELFRTSKDRADALQHILTPDAWADSKLGKIFTAGGALKVPMSQAKKGAGWVFDWLSDYNEAMENGVRLAAYKSALDKGMSKRQAASLAKNLTVNFNRKGQMGMQAGAVYAFFNAAMQGSARIGQTVFDMDGNDVKSIRLSKTGKQVVYGGILLGAIQAVALAWAGFDDEDPPEFVRERSLVIPIGDKKYLSIPMPLGFHVIPGIGRHAVEFALSGFDKPAARVVTMLGMFADGFNPIGNAGLSMQTVAPTALDPFVALSENRDWTGKPIARTSMNKATPGHALHKDTASSWGKAISEAINWVSGGNEYIAGVMSPTPDQVDYLFGQIFGGVGREVSKVDQTGRGLWNGESVPTFKMPLVGRFIGNAGSQASEGTAFYANVGRLNELETEIKGLQGDGRAAEAQQLRAGRPDAYLIAVANTAERQVQRLRKEKRRLVEDGASREQVRAVEARITEAMARLNRAAERSSARAD